MSKLKVFVAGHNGMVGSSLVRLLRLQNIELITKNRKELDLLDQKKVQKFFKTKKIDQVYLAAAKVGGIHANDVYPAEFIYQNILIQSNTIHNAFLSHIKKLLFLGSSCIYPKLSNQPMKEEELLTGKLELTNEPYAIAKIAGIKMCESYNRQYGTDYRCIMPTNTYGQNDNYDDLNSHFIPALIKKLHKLKKFKKNELKLWGDGSPKREVIYVNDLARACVYFMKKKTKEDIINIGTGIDYSIRDYANILAKVILPNKKIKIKFDRSKPNGTPRKVLDISLAKKYGWKPESNLKQSILETYEFFLKENASKYN